MLIVRSPDAPSPLISKLIDRLDNEPSTSSRATQIASDRELRERQKKENEEMELEVGCDLHPFRRDVVLTPSQRERRRKELEREIQEKEAKERKEEFEVRRDPYLFRHCTVLTTPQKRQRVLQCEKEENEAKERKEELEVGCNPHLIQRGHHSNPTAEAK